MEYNIKREERLIEALGLHITSSNNANKLLILDEEENEVGFIEFISLKKESKEQKILEMFNYLNKYSYVIKINSKDVYYEAIRKGNALMLDDNNYSYELNIRREDGKTDCLELILGENASLSLKSKTYGNMSFKINPNRMYLNFRSSTENFNLEETIIYQEQNEGLYNERKEYTYQLRYCPQRLNAKKGIREIKTCEISGESYSSFNKIDLADRSWYNGRMWANNRSTVNGTIEELIYKHKVGINAFNHFRYLINEILPFKEEVISLMCKEQLKEVEKMPFLRKKLASIKENKTL